MKERVGTKSYKVKLENGLIIRRHFDQMRKRQAHGPSGTPSKEILEKNVRSRSTRIKARQARYDNIRLKDFNIFS